MTAPVFTEVTEDGIAILTLNRAPVNALVPTFLADIAKTLNTLASDKHVHAVVLTSALKVLSGGFDLKAAQAFTSADGDVRTLVETLVTTDAFLYRPWTPAEDGGEP